MGPGDSKDFHRLEPAFLRIGFALFGVIASTLDRATVADPPYNYEDRRQRSDLPFRNRVPERHDLLLMKAVRAARHDEEVIQEMHQAEPFDLETIVARWNEEMEQAIGMALLDHDPGSRSRATETHLSSRNASERGR